MKRRCLGCHALILSGSYCKGCNPRRGSTRSWRQIRAGVLFRDAYICAVCGAGAAEVDHVVPLGRGGSDEPANLRSLCRACHHAAH